jgi:hypothetical protein
MIVDNPLRSVRCVFFFFTGKSPGLVGAKDKPSR